MTRASHHPNNIWRAVQAMELLYIQLLSSRFQNQQHVVSPLTVTQQALQPQETTNKVTVLCVLTYAFYLAERNGSKPLSPAVSVALHI
jgi:hypothetical protein